MVVDNLLNFGGEFPAVTVTTPTALDEALAELHARPEAHVLAGGTDFMVEVNFGLRRPVAVLAVNRVGELRQWRREGDHIVLGAGLTYTDMAAPDLAAALPALAQAARTVGSPQIRNAGTLGGNLGTASPAGDTLPVLAALGATVVLARSGGSRELRLDEFLVGPKRTAIELGELITEVRVPAVEGPQEFLKVGTRNAMVIAVAAVALVLDRRRRTVGCGLGSVGPVPLRAPEAEAWLAERITWDGDGTEPRLDDPEAPTVFGEMVAAAARPIDDHRSTAAYRRHAVGICARRAAERALR